ncbi:MAG TPA: TonB-dependent receptor [Rickettsiales bacterium]|nr:TonB-dependent receptor [Rickettsiales bacterium]
MKKILATTASMVALTLAYAGAAHAQTINYGSLQELFGEPVTTSATGKPQKASEAPVAMDIITSDDIRRSGAQTIPQILSRVDGVMNWQSTRAWSDVGVRGQNQTLNPTLLVLVNGRQVYIDTYGYTDWTLIPVQLEEIRQIEVVKGPNTALFGFNAVSGVVNIVTYNPKYDNVKEAGVTVGTGEYRKAHAVATVSPTDWASVRVSGSTMGENEFNKDSNGTTFASGSFQPEDHAQDFNLDSIFQINSKTQLRLEGSLANSNDNEAVFYSNSIVRTRVNSEKATLTSQTNIGLVEANVYQNDLISHSRASGVVPALAIENKVTVAQLQDLFKIGTDHSFRVMGEYRYNTMQGGPLMGNGDIFYSVWAGSAMWNWAITPKLELTNAVRLDTLDLGRRGPFTTPFTSDANFDESTTALSENSGLVWKATDLDTFRVSYARGIQAPSLVDYGIDLTIPTGFPGVNAYTVGQPALKPSIVTNYELGYDRLISQIGGKLRTDVYYKNTRDVMSTSAQQLSALVSQAGNIGDTRTEGLELKLDGRFLQDWSWGLGYAYQTTDDNFTVNQSFISVPIDFQDTFPHHVLNGHLGWAKGPWEADVYGQVASGYKAITTTAVPSHDALVDVNDFHTLSARVGYTFDPGITIALSGLDISQASVPTSFGLEEEREVFLSLSKKF